MKILTRFIGSTAIAIGLVIAVIGGSTHLIRQTEKSVEQSRDRTNQAVRETQDLRLSLEEQTSALKDYLLLNRSRADLDAYEQAKSQFLEGLKTLETLIPNATQADVVRRRHQLLVRLVDGLANQSSSTPLQAQQDVKSINSFQNDIKLFLNALTEQVLQEDAITRLAADQFKQTATLTTYALIVGVLLILIAQFALTLLPVIRSIQTLQLGANKLGAGDWNYRLNIHTGDEIEQLAQEFNQMATQLADSYASLEQQVEQRTTELQKALQQVQQSQVQLVQSEKMAALGQLVAGVAHEINNPVNFIHGNLSHVQDYTEDLLSFVQLYQIHSDNSASELQNAVSAIDLEFIQEDLPKTLASMKTGTDRICEIVRSLRNFSRLDESFCKAVDIHEGLNSTLMILQHRLKNKPEHPEIQVIREYGQLSLVECYAGSLNQVFMNILANAIDALEEMSAKQTYHENQSNPNRIVIKTSMIDEQWVQIAIADNGSGIPPEIQQRIFDPFFTTKPIGKGTGMGMSISYQIIVEKHAGKIDCFSKTGAGTEFIIQIPLKLGLTQKNKM